LSRNILIFKYSKNEKNDHSIKDDKFYLKYFLDHRKKIILYTTKYFYSLIKNPNKISSVTTFDGHSNSFLETIFSVKKINIKMNDLVTFSGYSEFFVLLLVLKNYFKNFKIILIATNNFGHKRLKFNNYKFKLFFFFTRSHVKKIIVHSEYEKRSLVRRFPALKEKIEIKLTHLMSNVRISNLKIKNKNIISFFGPEKNEKPLKPLFDLIRLDVNENFSYKLYRVDENKINRKYKILLNQKNVTVEPRFQTKEKYHKAIINSTLIMLTHTKDFSGKLSGQFTDSVSCQTPFISSLIEPNYSINEKNGPLGFLYDFKNDHWCSSFLRDFSFNKIKIMSNNLKQLSELNSISQNIKRLNAIFLDV
jgi:hypothetical protein